MRLFIQLHAYLYCIHVLEVSIIFNPIGYLLVVHYPLALSLVVCLLWLLSFSSCFYLSLTFQMLDSTEVESLHVLATFKRSPNVPRLFRTCPSNGNKNGTTTTVFFFGIAFCFWPLALPQLRPPSRSPPFGFSHLFGLACLLHFLFRFGCPEKLYTHICCASIGACLPVCVCERVCARVFR